MVFSVDAVSEKASVRGIIFKNSIIEENMENFDSEIFYMFYIQSKSKIAHFNANSPVYPALDACILSCYEENIAKDVCYKLPIRANIYLLMTSLLRYYCGSKDESDKMIYHNVLRLRPVMDYITENYCKKIYIDKLSDMIGVSADYFTKMFKDSIGKTPIEYINGLRINRAMQLLSETELPMAEIAESTGFCNPNYFHKIFKQYMETSPLVFRKSVK
jgi:YesN/AraC family two-component response regulator